MKREEIVDFLETVRPELKGGDPEDVLLKAARRENLSPAQLEASAHLANTAQQLNFMKRATDRGDSFRLLDVPGMLDRYTRHPAKPVAEKAASAEKAGTVKQRGDKWVLLSKAGKVLGTHEKPEDAYRQEYAIQKSIGGEKAASLFAPDPAVAAVPLEGDRAPNLNQIMLADAGFRGGHMKVADYAEPLPLDPASTMREKAAAAERGRREMEVLDQIIDDNEDVLRKAAADIAYRIRTRDIPWGEVVADAAAHGCGDAAAAIGGLMSQVTGPLAPNLGLPCRKQASLAFDRHGLMPLLGASEVALKTLGDARAFREYLTKDAARPGPAEQGKKNKNKGGKDDKGGGGGRGAPAPHGKKKQEDEEVTTGTPAPVTRTPMHQKVIDMVMQPRHPNEDAHQMEDRWAGNVTGASKSLAELLGKIPGPGRVNTIRDEMFEKLKPSRNKKRMKIDQAVGDTASVTTLQRMMLTDPIIRDADPDTVASLYNTLNRSNPEVAGDPNLLRFALREAIQYDAVPLHTYKDLTEIRERKGKAVKQEKEMNDAKYAIP